MDFDSISALSKSERIRILSAAGYGTRAIACKVYGTLEPTQANLAYVRVVAHRRTRNGAACWDQTDRTYKHSDRYKAWRRSYQRYLYASDPRVRAYHKDKRRRRWLSLRESVREQKTSAPSGAEVF
jgi:hypothetical protein